MKKFTFEFIKPSKLIHRNINYIINRQYIEYSKLIKSHKMLGLFGLLIGTIHFKSFDELFLSEDYLDMQEQLIAEYRGLA